MAILARRSLGNAADVPAGDPNGHIAQIFGWVHTTNHCNRLHGRGDRGGVVRISSGFNITNHCHCLHRMDERDQEIRI